MSRREASIATAGSARTFARRRAWLLLVAGVVALLLDARFADADAAGAPRSGWVAYDKTHERQGVLALLLNGDLVQPLIKYITDCEGSDDPADCGGTPARWPSSNVPVRVCSAQSARPSGVSAQEFRDLVALTTETWNSQEIAVGVDYLGDCVDRDFWVFSNLQNEIGWDDQRQVLASTQAAVTRSSIPLSGGVRVIRESDVVLDPDLSRVPRVCLESTIAHEFGHFLGLGHSDDRNDLMYPSFDPNNSATCKVRPSVNERGRMQALYGVDRAPSVTLGGGPVEPSTVVTVTARGTDPEGGALTFGWKQISGPTVTLVSEGATARFVAPSRVNDAVVLQVTALDRFRHPGAATANFIVSQSVAPPGNAPELESFLPGTGDAILGWSASSGAATYEICGRPVDFPAEFECSPMSEPRVAVSWDTVLGAAGRSTDYRLITTGARETFLRACNSRGCSAPGIGGLSGGLRWVTWGIDYDYLVFVYDVGTIQFTIVGVVNESGEPRTFTLGTGPGAEPARVRLASCGQLPAAQVCFGFLGPGGGHGEYVDILATAPDRPTIEHRIRVR